MKVKVADGIATVTQNGRDADTVIKFDVKRKKIINKVISVSSYEKFEVNHFTNKELRMVRSIARQIRKDIA